MTKQTTRMVLFVMVAFLSVAATTAQEPRLHWQTKGVTAWAAVLETAFSDSDAATMTDQWYAAYALGQYEAEAKAAVPGLVKRLGTAFDDDTYVRAAAARSLGLIGDPQAVPALAEAIPAALTVLEANPDVDYEAILRNAAWALGAFGKKAADTPEAVVALETLLKHPDPQTRAEAAGALWKISRHNVAFRTLIAMLKSKASQNTYHAAMVVTQIGPQWGEKAAGPVSEALTANLETQPDQDTARACEEALCAVGPMAVPTVKTAYAGQKNAAARARMLAVLGTLAAAKETPLFLKILADADEPEAVRIAAVRAVPHFPAAAKETARDALVGIINDKTSPPDLVREAAEVMKL